MEETILIEVRIWETLKILAQNAQKTERRNAITDNVVGGLDTTITAKA